MFYFDEINREIAMDEPNTTITLATTAQNAGGVFFLEQVLDYSIDRETIIAKAIELYPPYLLTSDANLYVLVDIGNRYHYKSGILAARAKSFLRRESLDEFVRAVEAARKGIVVVSFGQDDFDRFSDTVGRRVQWGIHEMPYQDRLYKVHKYGNPAGRKM